MATVEKFATGQCQHKPSLQNRGLDLVANQKEKTMETQVWVNPDRNNLILQTRFARRYGFRLGRLYRRVSNMFRFLQIFTGSAAFSLVIGGYQGTWIVATVGLIMAFVSAVDMVWQPSDLSSQCVRAAEQWGELSARAVRLDNDTLLERVTEMQALSIPTWKCLINPVFNDLMRETYPTGEIPDGTLQGVSPLGRVVAYFC